MGGALSAINVGVIGCGYWGSNLIRNLAELPAANLMAVADLRKDRLARIRSRYPHVWATEDYWELFSMPLDALVVATPPLTHFRIAQDCLEHNLNVLVEKPLTTNSQEAEALIEMANMRGLTLMVGHTFTYNSAVQTLKQLIHSGDLGEIFYLDAVRVNLGLFQPNLNVLWDLAPHDLSILLYLLESEPVMVSAQGADCVFKGMNDIAYLNLEFPDVMAHVHVSWLDPCAVRRITVVGSKKMAVYDDVENTEKLKIYDKGVSAAANTDSSHGFQCSYRSGDTVIPSISMVEPLRAECEHFVECIIAHKKPQTCGVAGLKVVRVLEAAERSMYHSGVPEIIDWVPVQWLEERCAKRQLDAWPARAEAGILDTMLLGEGVLGVRVES